MVDLVPTEHDPWAVEPVSHNPFEPIPLSQTAGRVDAPWRPDQIAPSPQHLTSMANNPVAHGIGEAILSPITEAGEYVGGLMQGTIPFEPGEAIKEGLKLSSAFVGPGSSVGAAKLLGAGAAKLAPMLSIFAGPMAQTADRGALRLAQQMTEKGMDRRQIWDATGWFTGADNKWRFEIPDHGLKVREGTGQGLTNAENAIQHPAVEDAYSQLDNLTHDVTVNYKEPPGGAFFHRTEQRPEGHIQVNGATPSEARSIASHELQHPIQRIEGFATGGNPVNLGTVTKNALVDQGIDPASNPDMVANLMHEAYRRHAGEVEARNVQRRLFMPPDMRREIPPWTTEDVPRDKQIVRSVSGDVQSSLSQESHNLTKLFRAHNNDDTSYMKKYTSWTESPDVAEAYTSNPGFGGKNIRSFNANIDNILNIETNKNGFEELARDLNYENPSEVADKWWTANVRYPWEEFGDVSKRLQKSGYDFIRYDDDFPDGARTIVPLKDVYQKGSQGVRLEPVNHDPFVIQK